MVSIVAGDRNPMLLVVHFLTLLLQANVLCFAFQYKVGDLNAWGLPSSSNPDVYAKWSKFHNLTVGDSLLFLYPPSQDLVIQVTEESFKKCHLKDPILYMNNGNSLFNITSNGDFYFTSGVAGHCEKKQKLHIRVGDGSGAGTYAPSYAPTAALPDNAPSYPTVFGSIPMSASSSPSILPLLVPSLVPFAIFPFLFL